MKYQKQPLSIAEQIAKLEGRGLQFDDKDLAAKYPERLGDFACLEKIIT